MESWKMISFVLWADLLCMLWRQEMRIIHKEPRNCRAQCTELTTGATSPPTSSPTGWSEKPNWTHRGSVFKYIGIMVKRVQNCHYSLWSVDIYMRLQGNIGHSCFMLWFVATLVHSIANYFSFWLSPQKHFPIKFILSSEIYLQRT